MESFDRNMLFKQKIFYHLFNRGNNSEKIFYRDKNYFYFLKKFDWYLSKYLDVYAFCLMSNHFHVLVKVKSLREILQGLKVPPFEKVEPLELSKIVSKQFRLFFTSYAMSINKQQSRHGSLFEKNFKRIPVTNQQYLKNLIYYIHMNPVQDGFVDKPEEWQFSSYNLILKPKETKLKKKEVLNIFENKQEYANYHRKQIDLNPINNLLID